MDANEKQEITDLVREAVGEAVAPLARRVDKLDEDIQDVRERVTSLAEADVKFAEKMTKIAGAAADAADIGLKAMRRAADAEDNATKIVQSAMTIHNASIASSVEATVTKAVEPLTKKVGELETNDKNQNDTLAAQNETLADIKQMVGDVVKAIGHPVLRKVLIVAAIVGALIGSGIAGYEMAHGGGTAKKTLSP